MVYGVEGIEGGSGPLRVSDDLPRLFGGSNVGLIEKDRNNTIQQPLIFNNVVSAHIHSPRENETRN
jgi:hypothetical protein